MNLLTKIPLPAKVTRALGKLWLKTKAISPELCVGGGIVVGVGALVMVGVKTYKNKDILERDISRIKQAAAVNETEQEIETIVTDEDGAEHVEKAVVTTTRTLTDAEKKLLWSERLAFWKDILKTYWIPATMEAGSIVLIWKGRSILRKDLSKMTIAYTGLMETYRRYREKVAKEIGEEKERQLAAGYTMEERVDEATGKKETLPVVNPEENMSQYSFWFNGGYFDRSTGEWGWRNPNFDMKDKLGNRYFVKAREDEATYLLRTVGYWWLEDTALKFGLNPEEAAKFHDIGMVYEEGGLNRVSFGVFDDGNQLAVNKGFCDDACSQNECLINPIGVKYIGYVRDDYRKYDRRFGYGNINYSSDKRATNRIMQRYNKEKMESMILGAMSDKGRRTLMNL